MRILVTGASGLVGKNFIRHVLRQGHEVFALVRDPQKFKMLPPSNVFKWNHLELPSTAAFAGVESVVHLAGENIADGKWTKEQKKRIVESRVFGTQNLVKAIEKLKPEERPKVLIAGSAVGYYGYNQDGILDESSSAGEDFLARVCLDWEAEGAKAEALGVRVVFTRLGIVLSKEGGALSKMPPIQIGSGMNWMSWIHIEDVVRIILYAIENESLRGPVNCVAANPVQSKEFIKELARVRGVPKFGFVPRIFLDLALGEVSNVINSSVRAMPNKLSVSGFKFLYPELRPALEREFLGGHIFDRYYFKDQYVPLTAQEIFPYFSRAENLEELTPPWLNFKIISSSTEEVQVGTLIKYKLKIHGMPVFWRTLIKDWKKNESFIDEQLNGPYTKWHHVHSFVPVLGGCLLRDEVTYRIPGSIFGDLILQKMILKDVGQIFDYRQMKIQERFFKNWSKK